MYEVKHTIRLGDAHHLLQYCGFEFVEAGHWRQWNGEEYHDYTEVEAIQAATEEILNQEISLAISRNRKKQANSR
jgi:hypothetical protein